jgi:hypothetical protein
VQTNLGACKHSKELLGFAHALGSTCILQCSSTMPSSLHACARSTPRHVLK